MRVIIGLIIGGLFLHYNGSARADFDEGLAAYERGDYSAAIKEFRILAEQGEADAQDMLGAMYASGRGVPRNYLEAVKWGKLAAEQGHGEAQLSLAMLYAFGMGVGEVDAVEAYKWALISAGNGVASAENFQKYIEQAMSQLEIEEAQGLARECIKNNYEACADAIAIETRSNGGSAGGEQLQTSGDARIEKAKIDCEELGFTPKTESFGNCVLKLMD